MNFQMSRLVLEKAEEPDQTANIWWIIKKAREFQKNTYFCFIDYTKAIDCVDHNKLWEILKRDGNTRPPYLSLKNMYAGQEATVRDLHRPTGSKLGKKYDKAYVITMII